MAPIAWTRMTIVVIIFIFITLLFLYVSNGFLKCRCSSSSNQVFPDENINTTSTNGNQSSGRKLQNYHPFMQNLELAVRQSNDHRHSSTKTSSKARICILNIDTRPVERLSIMEDWKNMSFPSIAAYNSLFYGKTYIFSAEINDLV